MTQRRCTAKAKGTGARCKRRPIVGGTVCAMHGGAAPQVQRRARERLEELVEPAIAGLRRALQSDNLPAIVRASQLVLDRCGFGPTSKLEVEPQPVEREADPVFGWIPKDRLKQMAAWQRTMLEWHAEAKAAMKAGEDPPR